MSNYVNLTDSKVEAFWKLPTLSQLLQLIRDNCLTQRIAWKARSGTASMPTFYTNLSDITGKNIRALTSAILDYCTDNIDRSTLQARLQLVICSPQVVADPFMREPIAIINKLLDCKQIDIPDAFDTYLRLKNIHDAKCVTQQGPPYADVPTPFPSDLQPTPTKSFVGHLFNANKRMGQGDYRGALISLEQVVKIIGIEGNLIVEQCICYFQLGELRMARRLFERWLANPHGDPAPSELQRWEKLPPAKP